MPKEKRTYAIAHRRDLIEETILLYTYRTFTCPSANIKTTQKNWDRAFLGKEEFEYRYGQGSYHEAQPDNGTDSR